MDRSFLTDKKVIEASPDWVCIRLATYEDSEEAKFLEGIYSGRSGALENTVFALLSDDGKTQLCRPGRSPQFAFRNADKMAEAMKLLVATYPLRNRDTNAVARVPQMKNFRLSLNVAACDNLPLLVAVGENKKELTELKTKIATLAFDDNTRGKFIFASTLARSDLKVVENYDSTTGLFVITPGQFGLTGKASRKLDADLSTEQLKTELLAFAKSFTKSSKDRRIHVSNGYKNGFEWETEIPVTDEQSNRAKERMKNRKR